MKDCESRTNPYRHFGRLSPSAVNAEPPFMVSTKEELDAKIAEGLADLEAGRMRPAKDVFRRLGQRIKLSKESEIV